MQARALLGLETLPRQYGSGAGGQGPGVTTRLLPMRTLQEWCGVPTIQIWMGSSGGAQDSKEVILHLSRM